MNDNLFTVEEVLFGIIASTVIARGVSNILCALGVYTVDLKTYQDKLESRLKEQQAAMALTDIKYKTNLLIMKMIKANNYKIRLHNDNK